MATRTRPKCSVFEGSVKHVYRVLSNVCQAGQRGHSLPLRLEKQQLLPFGL